MRSRRRFSTRLLVVVGVCLAGGASAAALALSDGAAGSRRANPPVGSDGFAVFKSGAPARVEQEEPELASLAAQVGLEASDRGRYRMLADGLGGFDSRLVAFPARGGKNVCYSLLAAKRTDIGMSYCYQPQGKNLPAALAGERFSVVAPQAFLDGVYHTQVFGIADDGVAKIRVLVAGSWHDMPIVRNGFYLDLPGIPQSHVSIVEATLADGSTQVHDVRTGE